MKKIESIIGKIRFGEAYPPATVQEIDEIQKNMGVEFPPQYVEFLKLTDGLSGNLFYFEPVRNLPERNAVYEMKKRLPGWLRIGSDGGGYSVLFNLKEKNNVPYLCEDGAFFEDEAVKQSDSFFAWLEKKFKMTYHHDRKSTPEQKRRKQEVDFKRLVGEARACFKRKDFRKTVELLTRARKIKPLAAGLDEKHLEYAKKREPDVI